MSRLPQRITNNHENIRSNKEPYSYLYTMIKELIRRYMSSLKMQRTDREQHFSSFKLGVWTK